MRRRRRQNPLLAKTALIGVGATLLILPILAKLGLFKEMHESYIETQLINLPPPPPQPKEEKAKAKKPVHAHVEGKRGARITHATVQVHVQAAAASKGAPDNGNQIVNAPPGGPVGVVPTGPARPESAPPATPAPSVTPVIPASPAASPAPTSPAPKQVVVVEAEPIYQPSPVIPEDLLDSGIDTTFYGYFTIHTDGTVDVKMVQGTGNSILDRLAMDAAKQWKFTPATQNGVAVESYRRLQVEFVVS
jgi:protein TonB